MGKFKKFLRGNSLKETPRLLVLPRSSAWLQPSSHGQCCSLLHQPVSVSFCKTQPVWMPLFFPLSLLVMSGQGAHICYWTADNLSLTLPFPPWAFLPGQADEKAWRLLYCRLLLAGQLLLGAVLPCVALLTPARLGSIYRGLWIGSFSSF